ncbi:MAG: dihydrodipicolinate synthase family protein [Armatimonadota bacterium]
MSGKTATSLRITGLVAAPHTPMHADGSVNVQAIQQQARLLAEGGVDGAFICGTTGEGFSLTVAERLEVAESWRAAAHQGFHLIVHVGHLCLSDCRELAAHAQKIGARAIGTMGPCFFRPGSVADLVAFCADIAGAAPELPFYYYHIPELSGVHFRMLDFLELGSDRIPTLAGIKFTYEDLMDFGRCVRLDGGRFNMLFGRDEILLAGLALGADGAVGSTYNYAAPLYRRLIEAFEGGDMATAQTEQARAMELVAVLDKYGGLAAGKAVMKAIGLDCGPVRPPLRGLSEDQFASLCADLDRVGFSDYAMRA